jgi:HNH endonuclease
VSTGSPGLRWFVATRADHLCEYCLIHAEDTFVGCHIDHIISEKHGGRLAVWEMPDPATRRAPTGARNRSEVS